MLATASPLPSARLLWWATWGPWLVVVWIALLRWLAGPFWLVPWYDPTYAYLLNAANLAEGVGPWHVDHPGTPLQLLGAVVLHGVALLSGRPGAVAEVAIQSPELCLWGGYGILLVFHGAVFQWAARRLAMAGLGPWAVAAVVFAPVWTPAQLLATLQPIPELLLSPLVMLVAVGSLVPVPPAARRPLWHWALLGGLAGLALATKLTALPLLLLPLWLAPDWRGRIAVFGGSLVAFAATTWPAWPRFVENVQFWYLSATSGLRYGSRELGGVAEVAQTGFGFWPFDLAVVVLLLALLLSLALRWRRQRSLPLPVLALASVALAAWGLWAIHSYEVRYLWVFLVLAPWFLVKAMPPVVTQPEDKPGPLDLRRAQPWLIGVLGVAWGGSQLALASDLAAHASVGEKAAAAFREAPVNAEVFVVHGASELRNALTFGDQFTDYRYTKAIAAAHPDLVRMGAPTFPPEVWFIGYGWAIETQLRRRSDLQVLEVRALSANLRPARTILVRLARREPTP